MPSTVIVNYLSVVHASSSGMAPSFPDVCKTPAPPAPVVPVPYPNIAQSADAAGASSTVKADGNPIMLKSSNFSQSSGDEAGTAGGGMMSNTTKGKAEFTMYSFDVKADGENVPRLTDPMQTNKMNPANSFNPAEIQATMAGLGGDKARFEACERTKKAQEEQKSSPATNLSNAGIDGSHHGPIQDVAKELKVVLYFRKTNHYCSDKGWIGAHHQPKPHSLLDGKTINDERVPAVEMWLWAYHEMKKLRTGIMAVVAAIERPPLYPPSSAAGSLLGVVMRTSDHNKGEPAKATSWKFLGKWITGDYDLYDVQEVGDDCPRPDSNDDTNPRWGRIMNALNKKMGWPGIQHGPQSQWNSTEEELGEGIETFSVPAILKDWLNSPAGTPVPSRMIAQGRDPLPMVDAPLTVVGPGSVTVLKDTDQVKDALICAGCGK